MFEAFLKFVREYYGIPSELIPLHAPVFRGNEKKYILDAIDSTFVSSVGAYVDQFEEKIKEITGAKAAIATVNGTSALHIALHAIGVGNGDEVITQPFSFVATANAISYTGAKPIFLDVDAETLGLSPVAVKNFLINHAEKTNAGCINRQTGKIIKAIVPMHTFGIPTRISEIVKIADEFGIRVIEDSAESLGSFSNGIHTGRFGKLGIFSFNGNKTITCGGGGAVITDDIDLGKRIKHITTTAKIPHQWEYKHDEVGFNYRMPNLNAAMACAQLELLPEFLIQKQNLTKAYSKFFKQYGISLIEGQKLDKPNYWLNAILLKDSEEKEKFLKFTNANKVMTRPAWNLLHTLPMYKNSQTDSVTNAIWLADRIVNIPSSAKY